MEEKPNFMKDQEMISMLEQLRRDIDADIEKRKRVFIGKDGREYYDNVSLEMANKEYIERMYQLIGKDGRMYGTIEELEVANQGYVDTMFPKIEKDENLCYDDSEVSHKRR